MRPHHAALSYAEVGATRADLLPAGYHHVCRRVQVGTGAADFAAIVAGMRSWAVHQGAGMAVRAGTAPAEGARLHIGLGLGPVRLWLPRQVVWVREEARAYGYGFGTLAGHPARGEDSLLVTLGPDGRVWFQVRAFGRPDAWYARCGPVTRLVREWVADRYVAVARRLTG